MGAAFNAMMEEESKESLARMCCELMEEIAILRRKSMSEKLNETIVQVCKDLDIPYDPHSSDTDPRAVIIFNALYWISR